MHGINYVRSGFVYHQFVHILVQISDLEALRKASISLLSKLRWRHFLIIWQVGSKPYNFLLLGGIFLFMLYPHRTRS